MNFKYTKPAGNPEFYSSSITAVLENLPGGRSVEIPLSSEGKITIEPRGLQLADLQLHDPDLAHSPLLVDLVSLITTGKSAIREFTYPRQNLEIRARSLQVTDPLTGNWISLAGFGLVAQDNDPGKPTSFLVKEPFCDMTLAEADAELMGNHAQRIGNLAYLPNGKTEITGGKDPLGGYPLHLLREKIRNTQQAATLLKGYAITPHWLFSARLPDLVDTEGEVMGVGAYALPPHLLQVQLAELAAWLESKGHKNELFQRFIFHSNAALNALHESGFVHLQPHRGNVYASLNDNFQPIIKDFTTFTDISNYPRVGLRQFNDLSPFTINMVQDLAILNTNMIRSLQQIENFQNNTHADQRLGLLPRNFKQEGMGLAGLAVNLAWAAAGRVAQPGTTPSPESIRKITALIEPMLHNLRQTAGYGGLDAMVQAISLGLVAGKFPHDISDSGYVEFLKQIRAAYVPNKTRIRH